MIHFSALIASLILPFGVFLILYSVLHHVVPHNRVVNVVLDTVFGLLLFIGLMAREFVAHGVEWLLYQVCMRWWDHPSA